MSKILDKAECLSNGELCKACGSKNVEKRTYAENFEIDGKKIKIENHTAIFCSDCGEVIVSPGSIRSCESIFRDVYSHICCGNIKRAKLINPDQLIKSIEEERNSMYHAIGNLLCAKIMTCDEAEVFNHKIETLYGDLYDHMARVIDKCGEAEQKKE